MSAHLAERCCCICGQRDVSLHHEWSRQALAHHIDPHSGRPCADRRPHPFLIWVTLVPVEESG